MEAATVQSAAPFVGAGQTTVGTAVRVEHRRPTPVGGSVEITAEASSVRGRYLTFKVMAADSFGELVAVGEVDRAILDRERFLEAAPKPKKLTPDRALTRRQLGSCWLGGARPVVRARMPGGWSDSSRPGKVGRFDADEGETVRLGQTGADV